MAEDFLTYTEADPNSRIAVTATKVTAASITRNENAWVYIDKGEDSFAGNFTHLVTIKLTAAAADSRLFLWGLTNIIDDMKGIDDASGYFFGVSFYSWASVYYIYQEYCYGGSLQVDTYTCALNTPYYLKIVRDESIGGNGRLNTYIYSDSARTTLLDTLQHDLSEKTDFQYVFALNTYNAGSSEAASGYSENLTLEDASAPTVTAQAVDDIAVTTATGHGTITSLGSAAVTQHGHCWDTSTNPTTANSKTTKGTGALESFISSMTSLSSNTLYYVRAYATNSKGTSYGDNVTFTTATTDMPSVETRPCSALTATTATGLGIIWSIGGSEVTEHGHCWHTSINPTTGNSKTTNGFGYYGAFTSAITSLTESTTYYIRAYAHNTAGTSYGNNLIIAAGIGSELAGPVKIVESRFHYVDKYGIERYVEGTAVP